MSFDLTGPATLPVNPMHLEIDTWRDKGSALLDLHAALYDEPFLHQVNRECPKEDCDGYDPQHTPDGVYREGAAHQFSCDEDHMGEGEDC